jgi:hypothetical protein
MLKRARLAGILLILLGLAVANLGVYSAHAHNWGGYHWNKGGGYIRIDQYNYAAYWGDAEAARQDAWNKILSLYNYNAYSHTDVSVYDGNFGNTGWGGLASLESLDWDWGCWCFNHISHGHARVNMYYGYSAYNRQRIFCQEVFHTYGFDHDDTNGCMDYTWTTNVLQPHNVTDFYNRYNNH